MGIKLLKAIFFFIFGTYFHTVFIHEAESQMTLLTLLKELCKTQFGDSGKFNNICLCS